MTTTAGLVRPASASGAADQWPLCILLASLLLLLLRWKRVVLLLMLLALLLGQSLLVLLLHSVLLVLLWARVLRRESVLLLVSRCLLMLLLLLLREGVLMLMMLVLVMVVLLLLRLLIWVRLLELWLAVLNAERAIGIRICVASKVLLLLNAVLLLGRLWLLVGAAIRHKTRSARCPYLEIRSGESNRRRRSTVSKCPLVSKLLLLLLLGPSTSERIAGGIAYS